LRLRICASQPRPVKPASVIAQVEGSGTAFKSSMSIEPSPLCTACSQDLAGEQFRQIGAAAAATEAGAAAATATAAGEPAPASAPAVVAAAAAAAAEAAVANARVAGAALREFRTESVQTTSAVAPRGAGVGARAAAAVTGAIGPSPAAAPARAASPARGASPCSAGGPRLSGTTATVIAPRAASASDSKDTGSEEDEAAAAAAAPAADADAAFCPCPPTKSVRVSPAVRTMSPETSAPKPPTPWNPPLPPLAPKTSSEYSPLTSTGKLCTAPVNRNVSASASAAQASIARAETPASNIALDLIMRFPHGRLPLTGRLTRGRFTAIVVIVNPDNARSYREIWWPRR
jgi:hypothetical protein